MTQQREEYMRALSVMQELILLSERHMPMGPNGAYTILDDVSAYVNSLELEIVKLRAGLARLSNQLEIQQAIQPAPLVAGGPDNFLENALKKAEQEKFRNKQIEDLRAMQEQMARQAREFPKVTL